MIYSEIPYYYINLESRPDRNIEIIQELNSFNIVNYTRIDAIKTQNPSVGCSESHIIAVKKFIESRENIAIILEDDFQFTINIKKFSTIIDHIYNNICNWDVVMISCNIRQQKVSNSLLRRCLCAQTTSGYVINKNYAPVLLENYIAGVEQLKLTSNIKYCIDQYWKKLQSIDKWFATNPKCGKQRKGYSDIEKSVVDYGC